MRKDERLKTIYETIAPHITRTEGNWRDYLAFAAHFHKHRFDNTLLVYAQNPNVTALATTEQWNKIGRYINRGAAGIAVCEYENAKLTISHLFDISQTNGRAVSMTDWQLDEGMRSEATKRLAYAHGYQTAAFPELILGLSAEAVSENYDGYLQTLKATAQNHIFAELPEGGLEAQFISLLTDSASYFIGKRCGLSDEEIITDSGMSTISHFNTIPLIATLGNAVTAISKGILLEMERTVKIINKERTEQHERTARTSGLHREGRDSVSEPSNLKQRGSGSAAGTVRQNGAGISERESSRPIYSFENGWQSDGGHAPDSERSDRADRNDDAANAENRSSAGNGGHAGTDAPPEQPEAVGGGNRDTGDRPDAEITPPEAEQPNTAEQEPSNDGSFALPISEYLERMMLTTLFYPPNFFGRLRYINASGDSDTGKAERIKAAYLSDGNHSGEIEGTPVSVTAADDSLTFHIGSDGVYDYSFQWDSVQELVRGFIENGSFPEPPPVMSDDEVRRRYEYILTSENLYPKELHAALRSFLTDEPENADWTEKAAQTKAAFEQYGGREFQGEVKYRTVLRDEGVQMYFGDGYTFLPWNMLANIVNAMIADGDYPAMPEIAEEETEPLFPDGSTEYDFKFEYGLLSRLRSDCEYFLGNGNRAEKHLGAGSVDAQIAKMRELYDLLPEKPEWLTEAELDGYEQRMKDGAEAIPAETLEEARQILIKAEYVVSDEMLGFAAEQLREAGNAAPTAQQLAEQVEQNLIDEAAQLDEQTADTVLSVVSEYAVPPEEVSKEEAHDLFLSFSPLFVSKVLSDEKYLAAREDFTDEVKAKIECGFAAERIMQSLREDNPRLYAAYAGYEGFRDRMVDYVFDRTYTEFIRQAVKIESIGTRKRATLPERNFKTFEKLFPKIVSGEYTSLRLEAGDAFDPLVISHKYDNRYAMEHYFMQNGDPMYDPYMEFILDTDAGTMQAASFENSGMGVFQEVYVEGGYYPKLQKELNDFLASWMKNISQQGYVPVRAVALVNDEDIEILFDENGNPITEAAEETEQPPTRLEAEQPADFDVPKQGGGQLSLFDFSPEADPVSEREEYLMTRGSGYANGKQRIYEVALTQPTGSAFASFLRSEYGTGGGAVHSHGISHMDYDSGGILYRLEESDEEVRLSWAKAAGIIQRLVNENRYLDAPAETEETQYNKEETDEELKILDEVIDSHHGQLDMVMTAYMGETPVGTMQYSLYENIPHIAMIEVLPEHRRQGIAARLLRNLQAQYPETELEWGLLTDDGKALYDAITYSVENEEYTRRRSDYDDITLKYEEYEQRLNDGGILSPSEADDMNDLSDIQYRLENELAELRPTKTFVRLSDEKEMTVQPEPTPAVQTIAAVIPEPIPAAHNFRYSEDMDLYPSGAKTKYKANIEAIKLLKAIEANHRTATPEEQLILARYVGWGGLANAFNAKSDEWAKEYQELKTLLSGDEYKAAMESTITAYYTEPELIRHIYTALDRFGFQGGADRKLLDPAMGTGNFYAVLPENLSDTKLYGVELDSITGRIARQLYPEANIQVRGYEAVKFEDDSFDAAIGNIPFNSVKVYDPRYNDENFLIHDYFIAKTLDLVKPGGIIAFITSKGTMDKNDETTREYIARRAELIGAVRLPNTAFKALAGTEVTADILFLKKREKQISLSRDTMPEWVSTEMERGKWIRYNSYFHQHPEMVLGEMVSSRNMYGREDGTACIAPDGYDLYAELERAVGSLQAEFSAEPDLAPVVLEDEAEDEQTEYADAPAGTKNFTFVVQDGAIFFCEKDKLIPQTFTGMKAARVKGLCEIREALLEVIAVQSRPYEESELQEKQAVLNEVYDRFVKKCGAIGSKANILVFSDDDQFPLLRSIENEVKDKDGNVTFEKAQIFYKATIHPHTTPSRADTAEEALYISLNAKLKIDLRYMSQLTGKEPAELLEELGGKVYLNPEKYYGNALEGWETAEEYLSGHVKDKLLYARSKAEDNPDLFSRNVTALEAAQPVPLTPADINASIGAPWIPLEYYRQFMYELLDTSDYYRSQGSGDDRNSVTLDYMEFSTVWRIGGKSLDSASVKVTQTYGTKRRNAYEIYEDCLNLQSTTIKDKETYTDYNGETKERYVVNSAETRIARSKQAQIKEAFAVWLWKDAQRKETLLNIYNDRFNTVVPREYNGSHLVIPGMSEEMQLRPHQLNFAARVIYSGTGLAAHEVGAGKTAALIAAGMFLKNLGAIQKPVYVVPNPLVGQWATEFYRFFPNARLLVSTAEDFSAKNRNRYISRIAMGDYDAVILAHSQFERIPISAERQEEQLNGQINQIAYAIERIKAEKGDNWTVKQMVAFQKNLETRLQKLSALDKKDDLLTFEQLGVDFMFVDEAHMFKNCFVYTKLSRVAGVNTSSSQRAFDMLNKCQYLQEVNNGRGVVFATGTPVSNSMSELFVMMRYLEPKELERQGVSDFDSWAATYGEIISSLEITPEGGGYRMRQRFAKFHNLPELMRTFKLVADIQTAEMLNLARPGILGGKAEVVSTAATPYQRMLMEEFIVRAEAIRKKEVSPHVDNMLKLTGEARLMAIDPRLIRANAPNEPESKLNLCIDRIYSIWQDTAEKRLTQLVFCDCGTPKPGQFNVYDEMKRVLMEKGVPENEIVFIHDAKTEAQRQAIFEKTRSGEIRVLIGSTGKLGTGVNVQDRVIDLHHLDVPWKPSDITQRNGRGLRQGNLNEAIGILHYITEGTFDAYLWQIQEQKLRYIMQIMTAKSIARSCEDIDETVLTAAQFKAIATDNPQLLVKMELENRVSELKLLQRNYQSEQSELERNIQRIYPAEIAQHEKAITEITADIESLKPTEGKDFEITLDGKVYDERVKAGEMLLLYSRMLKENGEEEMTVGEYRGFTLKIQKGFWDSQSLVIVGSHRYSAEMGTTEIGAVTRMENMTERIPNMLEPEKRRLSEVRSQLEEAKKQYGQPFAYEEELSEKSAALSDVNTELELGKAEDEEVILDENEQPNGEQDSASERVSACIGAEV